MRFTHFQLQVLIGVAAAALFIPFLGMVHLFDWDEINFAECAREMLVTHDYFTIRINFEPFWEKPPLFIWLIAGCMKLFGVNEFSTRLPDAICGIITLITIFNIGTKLYGQRMGLAWVLCYAGSVLPQFYFKSGIIDPWFNLFIFSGIYFFILFTDANYSRSKLRPLVLSAVFIGLAILTKGPVAFLIISLCIGVYWLMRRFKRFGTIPQAMLYCLIVLIIGGLWFWMLLFTGRTEIITDFFEYQVRLFRTSDAGHGGPFYFHFIVLLMGCFPASVIALRGLRRNSTDTAYQKHFKLWMLILFWVVLLLFSIVKTKIVHYSSLCYFPLTFIAAYSIHHMMNGTLQWKKWMNVLLLIIGSVLSVAMIALPFVMMHKEQIIASGIIHDAFFVENLQANVYWSGWECLIGVGLLLTVILCVHYIRRQRYRVALWLIFTGTLVLTEITSIVLPQKIEQYSQAATVEFFESLQGQDCYVETFHKSYASYFYSRKPLGNPNSSNIDWLLRGPIDKKAYFVCKSTKADEIRQTYAELHELYSKNGYVFFVRFPEAKPAIAAPALQGQ